MLVFSYRLILREEIELQASQGEQYARYRKAVPRLWPSPWPRVASSRRQAKWRDGFFVIVAASIGLFRVSSAVLQKKKSS